MRHKAPGDVGSTKRVPKKRELMKCASPGCDTRPTFGRVDGRPTHCYDHKVQGETYLRSRLQCDHARCLASPTVGPPGAARPVHCAAHALPSEGPIELQPRRRRQASGGGSKAEDSCWSCRLLGSK